jgi:phage-related minor tail protein
MFATAAAAKGAYFDGSLSYFANGGAFTNGIYADPTLFKFANGGQFGVMGEAGPEAVMPLSRDGNGRLGVSLHEGALSGGDSTMVNISITVNGDGKEAESASGPTGEEMNQWKQMANRVKAVVREELAVQQRPGGVLYK